MFGLGEMLNLFIETRINLNVLLLLASGKNSGRRDLNSHGGFLVHVVRVQHVPHVVHYLKNNSKIFIYFTYGSNAYSKFKGAIIFGFALLPTPSRYFGVRRHILR